jgi:phospholipid transport system substrate-binding protein
MWHSRAAAAAGLLLLLGAVAARAASPTPLEVVRSTNDRVLAIFAKHPVVDPPTERELLAVIDAVTDYDGIAGGAVDPFCASIAPAQCARFKETFKRLLRVSSIKKLGRYRADRFAYLGEETTGERSVVRTTAFYKEEKIPLDYELARRDGAWVIANYVVDEIDTVRNYRQQFTKLLAKGTVEQVIERLERKIADYEAEK